jgi:uncharacterized protein (DUF1697 family)
MPAFVALLRAVNVGGTGRLPMKELAALCGKLGFKNLRTYIQTGNVIFESDKSVTAVRAALTKALQPVDVAIRTRTELAGMMQ